MSGSKFFSVQNVLKLSVVAIAFFVVSAFAYNSRSYRPEPIEDSTLSYETVSNAPDEVKAKAAFNAAVKVFFSARCANCHPAGDTPTQGDAMTLHTQGVTRGKDGKGVYELACVTCHMAENFPGEHMPPGVPNWHMPPANQQMVFQGLTAGQLCRNLKDPSKNGGHKSLREAMDHIQKKDPLVMWAWAPGGGRSVPPMSFEEFSIKVEEWVSNGGACPD